MTAINKAVKIEEIGSPRSEVDLKPHDDLVAVDENALSLPSAAVRNRRRSAVRTELSSLMLSQFEPRSLDTFVDEKDEVPPLPDNWPKIPAIFERRSWDFTTAISSSVNKAAAHLELLQGIIEEWFKEAESRASRASSQQFCSRPPTSFSQASTVRSGIMSKRHLRFFGSSLSHSIDEADKQLSIVGVGAENDEAEEEYELPYLGGEEVVEEVICLLAKLENDRQEALAALKKQRAKSKQLKMKINEFCKKRLWDMPMAVQAEHDSCAVDLAELNWHVGYQGGKEELIIKSCEKAVTLNTKVKEDIAFINQHIPLVQEKLELEKEAMARIEQAQLDTDDEYSVVSRRCAKVQAKSDEAHRKAEEERDAIRRDLDSVRADLARITEELSVAKMNYNSYIHQANDYRQQIQDNEQEVKVLTVKSENARAAEAIQDLKVRELQKKLKEAEYAQKKLEEENIELRDIKEWKKNRHEKAMKALQDSIEDQAERLKKIKRVNNELDMDIEDARFKIAECDRQKKADDKNIQRMIKELARTEQLYDETLEDLAQITIVNQSTREQLEAEEERTLTNEEQLRATADTLKRQVKEEIHSRQLINSRVEADSEQKDMFEKETSQKKVKTEKMAGEVEVAVKSVKKKVDKLRNAQRERTKLIDDLKDEIARLEAEIMKMLAETAERRDKLYPSYNKLKEAVGGLTKNLDQMNWKQNMMEKKMEDMSASATMFAKSIKNSTASIDRLDIDLQEFNTQLDDAHQIDDELQSSLDVINTRFSSNDKHHKEHIKCRTEALRNHEHALAENFKLNKILAAKYRKLTYDYIFLRHRYLNGYGRNTQSEATIKDLKQLQGLQQKMHTALSIYYKYRGLFNQSELVRMQNKSNTNGMRVGTLQENMDRALDKIADFLQNQLDGDAIRQLAMSRVVRQEQGEVLDDVASVITASRPNTRVSTAMGVF